MSIPGTPLRQAAWRKKPVVIEAMQYDGTNSEDVICAFGLKHGSDYKFTPTGGLLLVTLESNEHLVSVGDFVIRGVKGEHYACKPDIFYATYEPESIQSESGQSYAYKEAIAQNLRLRKALEQCVRVAQMWHGDDAFDIYFNHSPEMKLVRDALGKMPDPTEE